MIYYQLVTGMLFSATLALAQPLTPQKWTASDGREIEATFVKIEGESVVIDKDGKQHTIPFAKLTPASVEQAKTLAWIALQTPGKFDVNQPGVIQEVTQFMAFANEVVSAMKSGDAERFRKVTIIGENEEFWAETKKDLISIKKMGVKTSFYRLDKDKRVYEMLIQAYGRRGMVLDSSIPTDGVLAVDLIVEERQAGMTEDTTRMRYVIAKTKDGWRIILPTTKK